MLITSVGQSCGYTISQQTLSLVKLYAHQQHISEADAIELILRWWLIAAFSPPSK